MRRSDWRGRRGRGIFFGGFNNVSADGHDKPVIEWAVKNVRGASVNAREHAPAPPSWFDDDKTIQAGAREFAEEGCVRCHGAPGRKPDEFSKGMNPKPPDLGEASAPDQPGKVFWIVKHGIRMTGMPEFGSHAGEDEIWRAVAFVKHLKQVTPADYEAWSGSGEAAKTGAASSAAPAQ